MCEEYTDIEKLSRHELENIEFWLKAYSDKLREFKNDIDRIPLERKDRWLKAIELMENKIRKLNIKKRIVLRRMNQLGIN